MKIIIYVSIDNIRRKNGGGSSECTNLLVDLIEKNHWGNCQPITRHRLSPERKIICRKRNSSRAFAADFQIQHLQEFINKAQEVLVNEMTADSDPGLCIIVKDYIKDEKLLLDYANKVKFDLASKEDAWEISKLDGLYLISLGPNGHGIIGALAGAILRFTGNDGQFRIEPKFKSEIMLAGQIIEQSPVEIIRTVDGYVLENDETVRLGEKVKYVYLNHKITLLVCPTELDYPRWQNLTTTQLRLF